MTSAPILHTRPAVVPDELVALTESGITVSITLAENSPCFVGHYPGLPIFPGVFSVELVHQAARRYCAAYFPGGRLVRVGARFLAPILPGAVLRCECTCERPPGGQELRLKGVCSVAGVTAAEVKLVLTRTST